MEAYAIAPGLWRWTGWREEWRQQVGCVYAETEREVCLIDPLVPPEEPARFWAALDRDVERVGGDVHVLLTVFWHARSARELVSRYGARLWAPSRARAAVERRAGTVTDAFRPGDPLPAGVEAFDSGRSSEVVLWLPEHRALVTGDVILGDDERGVRLCPESWLPAGTGHAELRRALRPLLELDVERARLARGAGARAGRRGAAGDPRGLTLVPIRGRRCVAEAAAKVAALLEGAEEDLLAFYAFPAEHRAKLRSTNPLERLNREIGRRTDVVGIFPDDASLIRLATSLVIEQNDERRPTSHYLSLDREQEEAPALTAA